LVGHIVVADKVMPVMANMREEEKRLFEDKQLLTFKQADLTKDGRQTTQQTEAGTAGQGHGSIRTPPLPPHIFLPLCVCLCVPAHVSRVFQAAPFDYVFNLCGETRFGLAERVRIQTEAQRTREKEGGEAMVEKHRASVSDLVFPLPLCLSVRRTTS
jgi:hypothetical protein